MKCKHGVHVPADMEAQGYSPYCTGCVVPEPMPTGATLQHPLLGSEREKVKWERTLAEEEKDGRRD